jgi:hypothetical protein
MQTAPVLDLGGPRAGEAFDWLGGHDGVLSAVAGRATVECRVRAAASMSKKAGTEPVHQESPGTSDCASARCGKAQPPLALVSGGSDWTLRFWDLEDSQPRPR